MKKTKLIVTGPGLDVLPDSGVFPCDVYRDGVRSASSGCIRDAAVSRAELLQTQTVCPSCRGQTRLIDGRPVTQVEVDNTGGDRCSML